VAGVRAGTTDRASFDVSRDGKRFLVMELLNTGQQARAALHVAVDWSPELKRLVPTK
jgi:hypothetical protein